MLSVGVYSVLMIKDLYVLCLCYSYMYWWFGVCEGSGTFTSARGVSFPKNR